MRCEQKHSFILLLRVTKISGEARDISPTLYVYIDPVADVELKCNVGTFWGCPLNPAIEH